jgi:hypothetical protein
LSYQQAKQIALARIELRTSGSLGSSSRIKLAAA